MSKNYLKYLLILIITGLVSCNTTEKLSETNRLSIQFGTNKGGIVENTDMSIIDNLSIDKEIDAYSGATSNSINLGLHKNIALKKNEIELGIDYINNKQSFAYNDDVNNWNGKRSFTINQLSFPLTYNLKIMPSKWENLDLQLKIGFVGQLSLANVISEGNLPTYSIKPASAGFTFGLSFYPVVFNNKSKLGFFLDGYRGSQIYSDYYNKKDFEMPGTAYVKYGLKYKF